MAHLVILAAIISMRAYLLFVSIALLLLSHSALQAQGLHIKRAQSKIVVDGEMNEADWQTAEVADQFKQYFPFDSSYAKVPTEVRIEIIAARITKCAKILATYFFTGRDKIHLSEFCIHPSIDFWIDIRSMNLRSMNNG